MTWAFAEDVLNSLTAHVAVLDAKGAIIFVNDAWKRFALENGCRDEKFYVGRSYLEVCDHALQHEVSTDAEAMCQSLYALLRGEGESFTYEYPCNSPEQERWFVVRITRFIRDNNTYLVVAHENITLRKQAEEALRVTEGTLRQVLELLPVGVWIMDRKGTIVHGNPAGQKIWEGARYVGPEQFGEYKGWWLSTGKPIAAEEWGAARAIARGEVSLDEEIRIESFDGSNKIILHSAMPLRDEKKQITGAIVVNQDITARYHTEEQLRQAKVALETANSELQQALTREQVMARTDSLTGINNRRHFFYLASSVFTVARRYGNPLSILLMDIDHFKKINDTLGHHAGDEVLKKFAQAVREHLREADIIARYGGEEFIVLLSNTNAEGGYVVAENIRNEVACLSMETSKGRANVTVSIGVAELASKRDTLWHLIHCADQALYAAKSEGRNRTVLYSQLLITQGVAEFSEIDE